MSQWHKLHWKEEHAVIGGIRLTPKNGKIHASHNHHDWNALDWSHDGSDMHHAHNGTVDHIMLHQDNRQGGIAVHAIWRDKEGNILRQDALWNPKKKEE
jgi:hypothetical protein